LINLPFEIKEEYQGKFFEKNKVIPYVW
jgi:hypothetical protein